MANIQIRMYSALFDTDPIISMGSFADSVLKLSAAQNRKFVLKIVGHKFNPIRTLKENDKNYVSLTQDEKNSVQSVEFGYRSEYADGNVNVVIRKNSVTVRGGMGKVNQYVNVIDTAKAEVGSILKDFKYNRSQWNGTIIYEIPGPVQVDLNKFSINNDRINVGDVTVDKTKRKKLSIRIGDVRGTLSSMGKFELEVKSTQSFRRVIAKLRKIDFTKLEHVTRRKPDKIRLGKRVRERNDEHYTVPHKGKDGKIVLKEYKIPKNPKKADLLDIRKEILLDYHMYNTPIPENMKRKFEITPKMEKRAKKYRPTITMIGNSLTINGKDALKHHTGAILRALDVLLPAQGWEKLTKKNQINIIKNMMRS